MEEGPEFQVAGYDSSGKVDIIELEDTEMIVRTRSNSESFLVTSDIFFPGWQALIDGKLTPLKQVDYILRGVALPAGSHEVRFQYHPTPFYAGLIATGVPSCYWYCGC